MRRITCYLDICLRFAFQRLIMPGDGVDLVPMFVLLVREVLAYEANVEIPSFSTSNRKFWFYCEHIPERDLSSMSNEFSLSHSMLTCRCTRSCPSFPYSTSCLAITTPSHQVVKPTTDYSHSEPHTIVYIIYSLAECWAIVSRVRSALVSGSCSGLNMSCDSDPFDTL